MEFDISGWLEYLGDHGAASVAGLAVGLMFGFASQRSRFCLRAATVEFARGSIGPRVAVWLLCFSTALFWTQLFGVADLVPLHETRYLAQPGSIIGAIIGGLMIGAGMVLARGCPGRLLVLAGTGNLRTLLAGLVFAVTAQMTLYGALGPLRTQIASSWTTGADGFDLSAYFHFGAYGGLALGIVAAALALYFARRAKVSTSTLVFGSGVGFAVGFGWLLTAMISAQAFDPVPIKSLTFSGPSAHSLMWLLQPFEGFEFDTGLIPGVFLGAMLGGLVGGEMKLVGFEGATQMPRYLVGAAIMGVGSMLAGGCAIGAGVTGASTFALAAWIALTAMWIGAMATDYLVDQPREAEIAPAPGAARA